MQTIGLDKALRAVTSLSKQVKFAASLALNDTAKDVQQFTLRDILPSTFTLRAKGPPWQRPGNKFGFNIKRATKINLTAVIGSQADWLKHQDKGGVRRTPSGHRMPIPTPVWKPVPQVMPSAKKPKRILGRRIPGLVARPFILKGGIYVRTSDERGPLLRLFTLKEATRIKAILKYEPRARVEALRRYRQHFDRRLLAAIATAK